MKRCGKLLAIFMTVLMLVATLPATEAKAEAAHKWQYTQNGNMLTAVCVGDDECEYKGGISVSVEADDMIYTGNHYPGARIVDQNNFRAVTGTTYTSIRYYTIGGGSFGGAVKYIVDKGEYIARITVRADKNYDLDKHFKIKNTPVSYVYYTWEKSTLVRHEGVLDNYRYITNNNWDGAIGWHIVQGDVTVNYRAGMYHDVYILLCDGATLTFTRGIETNDSTRLHIYGQSGGTGKLVVYVGEKEEIPAIGTNRNDTRDAGTIYLHGGSISANGGSRYSGIGSSGAVGGTEVFVYDGEITTTGGWHGSGINTSRSGVTVYGGKINAYGGMESSGIGGTFTMYGGEVYAKGGTGAAGIGGGYEGGGTDVFIHGGKVTAVGNEDGAGIGGGQKGNGGNVTIDGGHVVAYVEGIAAGYYPLARAIGHGYDATGNGTLKLGNGIWFKIGDSQNDIKYIGDKNDIEEVFKYRYFESDFRDSAEYVYYTLEDNKPVKHTATQTDINVVTSETTELLHNEWYIVKGNVTVNDRITVDGSAHLILADNSVLTANGGIKIIENSELISGSSELNIYGQTNGTGKLIAVGSDEVGRQASGIGVSKDSKLTIHGGIIDAKSGEFGAGIGGDLSSNKGGIVTIYDGTITATGNDFSAGIGGGQYGNGGKTYIYGGTVTTIGGDNGAGIGSGSDGNGDVTYIYGGIVTAIGGQNANAIGRASNYRGTDGKLVIGNGLEYNAGNGENDITVTGTGDGDSTTSVFGLKYVRTGHVHTPVKTDKVEPTCTENGHEPDTICLTCNEVLVHGTVIQALGHTGGHATCYSVAVCTRCDQEYGEFAEHNYSAEYTIDEEPTCTTSGYKSRHCEMYEGCRSRTDFVTLYSLGHDEVIDYGTPATCTETGLSRGMHCGRCNQVLVAQEVISALGHDLSVVVCDKTYHYKKCLRCSGKFDAEEHISSGQATETTPEVCTVCGYVIDLPTGHEHKDLTKIPAESPSCTENGTREYYVCSCGAWFFDNNAEYPIEDHGNIYIGKLLHVDEEIKGTPATCTNEGLTKGIKCEVCGGILIPQSVTPALGHKSIIGNKVEPTCTENGHEPDTICLTCNEVLVHGTVIQALGHTGGQATCIAKAVCDRCHEEYGELAEHNYSDEYTFDEEPTCTTSGYKSRHCLTVGCTSKTDVVDYDPLGHVDGNEDQYCERCHKYLGYYIIQGADFRWYKESGVEMIVSSDAEYSKFINVLVDGETVDKNNYSSVSGSTVITFKADYLETLSLGTHTCRIVSTDGYAECEFYVLSKPVPPTPYVPPKTGIN